MVEKPEVEGLRSILNVSMCCNVVHNNLHQFISIWGRLTQSNVLGTTWEGKPKADANFPKMSVSGSSSIGNGKHCVCRSPALCLWNTAFGFARLRRAYCWCFDCITYAILVGGVHATHNAPLLFCMAPAAVSLHARRCVLCASWCAVAAVECCDSHCLTRRPTSRQPHTQQQDRST